MGYCTRDDVALQFGALAIKQWADLDGLDDEDTIDTRIEWAIDRATEYVNSRLVRCQYAVPFDDPPPLIIRHITAMCAGLMLYDGRQTVNTSPDVVSRQRKEFAKLLKEILGGQLKLLNPVTHKELQTVVSYRAPFVPRNKETSNDASD